MLFLQLVFPSPIKEPLEVQKTTLQEMKALCLHHNLFPLVYTRVEKYGRLFSPEKAVNDFLEESKGLYLKGVALSAQQESVENEIVNLLTQRQIPSVVIKGNRLANEIYDDPNCRTSSDIDILIRREEAVMADSILREHGYIAEADIPLIYCLARIHHAIYFHPHNSMLVEMHWGFGVPYFFRLDATEIWREVSIPDKGEAKLSPEMILCMLLIHHHAHSFRELKILVDIIWTMGKYGDVIDWHSFFRRIRKAGLIRTTHITLKQMRSVWGTAIDQVKAAGILEQEIGTAGSRIPSLLLSYFRMNIDKDRENNLYKDKLVARFALDHWSTILLSYFRTLFPMPEAIRELYRDRRAWSLPFNYLRFIRWRVKEWVKG